MVPAGHTSRIYARSRQQNTKVSDDGSKRKKYTAVSGQPVPAAAHFAAPVESMKQLLQHTPVPTPALTEPMDSFKGVKVTKQMQQELEKDTQNDLAQVCSHPTQVQWLQSGVGGLLGVGHTNRTAELQWLVLSTQWTLQG
jgi:hypothetical protein